jgi:hypothetical protein
LKRRIYELFTILFLRFSLLINDIVLSSSISSVVLES